MSAEPEALTEAIDPIGHIVRTPGVMSGRARIKGSRVRVSDIVVARYDQGHSPEEIAGDEVYPFLSLADVYAALTYYCDHKDEIEAEFEEDDRFFEELRRDHPEQFVDVDE